MGTAHSAQRAKMLRHLFKSNQGFSPYAALHNPCPPECPHYPPLRTCCTPSAVGPLAPAVLQHCRSRRRQRAPTRPHTSLSSRVTRAQCHPPAPLSSTRIQLTIITAPRALMPCLLLLLPGAVVLRVQVQQRVCCAVLQGAGCAGSCGAEQGVTVGVQAGS
jgi:hypothetical protein